MDVELRESINSYQHIFAKELFDVWFWAVVYDQRLSCKLAHRKTYLFDRLSFLKVVKASSDKIKNIEELLLHDYSEHFV